MTTSHSFSRHTGSSQPCATEVRPAAAHRHLVPITNGGLQPDATLAKCRDCQVSCQSACKTSCTVGNQRCPK